MSFLRILPLWLVILLPSVVHAQYQMISPMLYEGPRISLQNHAGKAATAPRRSEPSRGPERRPSQPATDADLFRYRPDLARRRENFAHFVAKSRKVDPRGAASLSDLFAQGDIIERMGRELAKYGLRTDNVADAYTVWWINAWQATRGLTGDANTAATAAVRRQVMDSMGANPTFRSASDAAKQEMAESLLIQALLLTVAVEQAGGKPDQLAAVRNAALQGGRGMGLDLAAMTLTDEGFVPVH